MEIRLCTQNDIDALTNVVNHFDSIYGIDLDSSGLRKAHIDNIIHGVTDPDDHIVAAFDNDGKILGYCFQ